MDCDFEYRSYECTQYYRESVEPWYKVYLGFNMVVFGTLLITMVVWHVKWYNPNHGRKNRYFGTAFIYISTIANLISLIMRLSSYRIPVLVHYLFRDTAWLSNWASFSFITYEWTYTLFASMEKHKKQSIAKPVAYIEMPIIFTVMLICRFLQQFHDTSVLYNYIFEFAFAGTMCAYGILIACFQAKVYGMLKRTETSGQSVLRKMSVVIFTTVGTLGAAGGYFVVLSFIVGFQMFGNPVTSVIMTAVTDMSYISGMVICVLLDIRGLSKQSKVVAQHV